MKALRILLPLIGIAVLALVVFSVGQSVNRLHTSSPATRLSPSQTSQPTSRPPSPQTTPASSPTPYPSTSPAPGPAATDSPQIWEVTVTDNYNHKQIAHVVIKPFTYSGDFVETADSPGWWIFGTNGEPLYKLPVQGNIVYDSPVDRWDFVNFGGAGGGYQTLGTGQGKFLQRNYPDAVTASGSVQFKTDSPLGSATESYTWTAVRIK
jgi:hypothetical protein